MLTLYDTNHNKICPLTDYKDYYLEQAINIDDLLFFSYPIGGLNYSQLQFECYVRNGSNEYVIKEINVQGAVSGIEWVQVVCKVNLEDLKGYVVPAFQTVTQAALDTANLALAGTGWTVAYSDVLPKRSVVMANCSAYDIISEIAKAFLCEITYDAVNKYVIIHQKAGANRGAYFAEQLNLTNIQSQGNTNDYITRIIPIGQNNLGISAVNGGLPYVANYQYSSKAITAYWIDNRYTVAQDLMDDAIARLSFLSKPNRAYVANIIDLSNVSAEWAILDYSLGDFITLMSESKNIREVQRIIKLKRYPEEPERSTIEIANRVASLVDILLTVTSAASSVSNMTNTAGSVMAPSVAGQLTNAFIATANVGTLDATIANIGTLLATKALITDLTAINANITNLTANKANVTDLTAVTGRISILEVNSVTIGQLDAVNASITNIVITTAKIQDGAITTAKIGSLQVATGNIALLAVGSAQITDLAVTTAKIGNLQVTTAKIGLLQVTSAQIANATIGTAQIALLAVTTGLIANAAVDTAQIKDGSITDAKVVTLTANKITAGTINAAVITVTNLNAANITVGTINGVQISPATIAGSNVIPGTITNTLISANTITGDRLVVDSITAREIAVATITAIEIAALTITAAKIAIGTITAAQMTVGTITAVSGIIGSIDASKITTGLMTADRINGGILTLGGSGNVNGLLAIKNASGATVVTGNNTGLTVDGGAYFITEPGTQKLVTTVYSLPNLLSDSSFEGMLNYDLNAIGQVLGVNDVLGFPPDPTYGDYNPECVGNWYGWNTHSWSGSTEGVKMSPHWFTTRRTYDKSEASNGKSMAVVNSTNYFSQGLDLVPGQTYFLTVSHRQMISGGGYVYRSTALSKVRLIVEWGNGLTLTGVAVTNDYVSTTAWQRSGFLITVPATGVNGARIRVSSPDANWIYVDGVQLVQGSVPGKFEPMDDLWSHINNEIGFQSTIQQSWLTPTLLNGWKNFDVTTDAAAYYKDSLGFVVIRGIITGGTVGANIFTLPVGYRPLKNVHRAQANNNLFASVGYNSNGTITTDIAVSAWLTIDARFKAEQ